MRRAARTIIGILAAIAALLSPFDNAQAQAVVGAIEGSGGAGGLGGATYTIPIQVPEGLGGMQPSLAVGYNSQGGNGLLGWCWDLQGLSSITRMGTTLYHDGAMSGVDFDDDRFALDGQRLICVSGTYGANGAEYRTETDAMARIVSYTCDTTYGPAWFKVWLPNGNIAYYGNTQDSRIGLQQQHDVSLWLLSRMEDRNGNYMEYHYVRGGASYLLDWVRYGGNADAGISCCYTVKCHYSERDDKEVSFIGDNTLDQKHRLDSIRVMRGYNVLHKYGFEYYAPNLSSGYYYTRLYRITFSCGGESYNPTVVQWGTNDYGSYGSAQCHGISVTGGSASDFVDKIKFTGDLNGDGYTDVIVYEPGQNRTGVIYLNKGLSANGDVCFAKLSSTIPLGSDIDWIHTPDINGDGLDDILLVYFDKHYIGSDDLSLSAYLSAVGQDGSYTFTSVQQDFGEFPIKRRYKDRVLIGDFLGEGRQSILLQEAVDGPDVSRMVYITYSNGTLTSTQLPQSMTLDADRLSASDYNGDGITEISFMNRTTPSTGLLRMRRSGSTYSYETVNSNMLSAWHQVFPGDFNGDGKIDLMSYVEDSDHNPYWSLNYFKESSLRWPTIHFSEETLDIGNPETHSFSLTDFDNPAYKFITVGDFNGDGKADVAFRSAANYMKFLYGPVRMENGQGVFASTQTVSLGDIGMTGVTNQTICTGNFLGRENVSVFSATTVYALNPVSNRYSVTSVTDGMGNRTTFEYDYLMPKPTGASDADFYTRAPQTSAEQAAHIFTISLPLKGLKRMSCCNTLGESPVTEVRYRYNDAMVHRRGRGFLGFRATATENWIASTRQQTVERLSVTLFTVPCLALRTETVKKHNGSTISTTENENRVLLKRNPTSGVLYKAFVPVVWKQTSLNYDLNNPQLFLNKTITHYGYNDTVVHVIDGTVVLNIHAYDLLKQTAVHQGVDSCASVTSASQCEFQTLTQTAYVAESQGNLQDWVVNRPHSTLTTARRLGGYTDVTSLSISRYSDSPGDNPFLPVRVESYPGGVESALDPLATIEEHEYSPTGLVTVRSVGDVMSRLPVRRWRYEYSADGRFLVREINPAGDTTSYTYNQNYCYVTSETDPNGLVTAHTRTPLGSSFTTTYPDGRVTHGETAAGVADEYSPTDTYYIEWSTTTGGGMKKAYYNAAGQKLRTLSEGMDGEAVLKDYVYDDKGQLTRESLPYFWGDDAYWTRYQYDDFGRHIVTEHPDEMAEVTNYQGFTTWHTRYLDDPDDPPSTATTANAVGWVVKSVDEDGNEVCYDHYADGKLKTSRLGTDSGTTVSVGYDAAGNRTTLTDPNYGTVASVYDAYGQLVLTVSPKGDTTTYQYDVLGRMVKRYERNRLNNSVDSTEWGYSDLPGTRGLLYAVTFNNKNNFVRYYHYDNLCRIMMVDEKRKDDHYYTYYDYDNASRVSTITYPTGFILKREYSATGHLSVLRDSGNNILWETEEKNAMGQVTRYSTADGTTTERRYDTLTGRLTGILSYNLTDTIQNLAYVYDKSGNLASRTDSIRNMEERFTYDMLDRLTGVVEGLDTTGAFAYDAYGRMTSKYLHGAMVFDETVYNADGRPHAVKLARMYSPQPDMSMGYTSFDKLRNVQTGNLALTYGYGYEHQRLRMVETLGNDTVKTKEYVGGCEFVTEDNGTVVTKYSLTYLSGPLGVFAVRDTRMVPESKRMYYVHPDHLGSWTTVTAWNGRVVQDVWFDPWGIAYNIPPGSEPSPAASLLFDRGFTGHEHLMEFGLINMNGRMYDPVMSCFLSVDNYVQDPSCTQNFNRYTYCLNNPLKYTDPDGEIFWIIPNIGWSKESGLSFGLTFAVGLPGLWSAQASVGYSISSQTIYGSAGVTCAGVTGYVSAGYSMKNEQITASIGVTAGLSPYSGVPVSTNFFTVGASYDYTYSKTLGRNYSYTGQLSAWSYNSSVKKWHYNPSVSAMFFTEHTTNLVRGQGFQSNNKVFQRFVANNQYQQALDYFGFEGSYDPNCSDPGRTDRKSLTITYGDEAFKHGYDYLYLVADHEQRHLANFKSDKYANFDGELDNLTHHKEEWSTYMYNYKRQGLYPEHGVDLCKRINIEGFNAGVYDITLLPNGQYYLTQFSSEWWHFVYRIPRIY